MAMVSVVLQLPVLGGTMAQANQHGPKVGGRPVLVLHSSNKLGELSQRQCHDNSTQKRCSVHYYYYYQYNAGVLMSNYLMMFPQGLAMWNCEQRNANLSTQTTLVLNFTDNVKSRHDIVSMCQHVILRTQLTVNYYLHLLNTPQFPLSSWNIADTTTTHTV